MHDGQPVHALVLGGGLAGMLAASVLAHHLDTVTIVDRDRFPNGPNQRKGTPHARHTHVLVAGGARALDELLPGTTQTLLSHDAQYVGMPSRLLAFTAHGWLRRSPERQFLISCSRALLDWVVREQVLQHERIRLRQATEVVGLTGSAEQITGARVRDRDTGHTHTVQADIVVDTTGQRSQTPRWLSELGCSPVPEVLVDPDIFYASRRYRPPAGTTPDFPEINIPADPRSNAGPRGGVLVPIENGQWLVTLVGRRDCRPPTDDAGFTAFARTLRHPIISDLIATSEPLSHPYGFRIIGNRRRRYDQMNRRPEGLLVHGDAACTVNPVYGHGMALAALGALAIRDHIRRHGIQRQTLPLQRTLADTADDAWAMSTAQDLRYLNTTDQRPTRGARFVRRYLDRLAKASIARTAITNAQIDVYTLSAPPRRLLSPRVVLSTLRGTGRPPRATPPLTVEEQRIFTLPKDCKTFGATPDHGSPT
ncbi:NAD(P)/FAD-dependent oxidoreductase [Amycolatopsis sp. NPDC059021]|uniref:NAD(P)/FAD-dependent oxidoreductase n=1 Tax=Amycolatopsis sp. NPDC059021 TaxID=3346704 RepID=UPI00366A9CBA